MAIACLEHNLTDIDFGQSEICAVARRIRIVGDDGWAIIDLDKPAGRSATGELDAPDELSQGVAYRFFGRWEVHDKYGPQFKFDSYVVAAQQGQMGVVAYLSRSSLGLNKSDASRLWKAFGAAAIDTLRDNVGTVITELALGDAKACAMFDASQMLKEDVADGPTKIALFELFANRGFPRNTIKACIAAWGKRAPDIIRRNPFALLMKDIPGVGFKRADKLFLDLGGNPLRLKRQTLAAWHMIRSSGSGNTWEPEGVLLKGVMQATGSIADSDFDRAISLGVRAKWLARRVETDPAALATWMWGPAGGQKPESETFYAERANATAEERLARHGRRILGHKPAWPIVTAEDLEDAHQRSRLDLIRGSALALLTGTPGTGKTFAAAVLIRKLLEYLPPARIAVCAPTGKASVRITEAMRRYNLPLHAKTIHQTLEVNGNTHSGQFKFQRNESNPLDAAVVVVDEVSMLDTDLGAALFAAVPPGGCVLCVGDPYQLPPVGHGAPLRDMIAAGVPCGELSEIKRNAGMIVSACKEIKEGRKFNVAAKPSAADPSINLIHLQADTPADQLQVVTGLIGALGHQGYNPVWDVQVLVATNDKTPVSRKPLNGVLQSLLNPQDDAMPPEARNPTFRPGDKIICLKNAEMSVHEAVADDGGELVESSIASFRKTQALCYVANGDMGRVLAVDKNAAVVQFLFPDRVVKVVTARKKKKEGEEGGDGQGAGNAEVDLAYAKTVHKSQGSEYPVVIVVVDENAGPLGTREWIYTGISRASKLCFLVGKMQTAWKHAQRVSLGRRKTFLASLILEGKS